MTSIRWPRFILDRFKHKQRTVKRVSQGYSASGCASQVCDYDGLSNGLASNPWNYSGRYETNINQAVGISEARSGLKDNNRPAFVGSLGGAGFVAHFDPPSFGDRLSRACRAFVNAWRLP